MHVKTNLNSTDCQATCIISLDLSHFFFSNFILFHFILFCLHSSFFIWYHFLLSFFESCLIIFCFTSRHLRSPLLSLSNIPIYSCEGVRGVCAWRCSGMSRRTSPAPTSTSLSMIRHLIFVICYLLYITMCSTYSCNHNYLEFVTYFDSTFYDQIMQLRDIISYITIRYNSISYNMIWYAPFKYDTM